MLFLKKATFILTLIFLLAANSYSADFFASDNGSGNVCSKVQPCSIRQAFTNALLSNDINNTIYLDNGTYKISESLKLIYISSVDNGSISVIGKNNTVLDAQGSDVPAVEILYQPSTYTGFKIKIKNIQFKNDQSGALVISSYNADVDINNVIFDNNSSYDSNGGALSVEANNINISNSIFKNNSSQQDGGGAYAEALNTAVLFNSKFYNNTAEHDGGGVRIYAGKTIMIANSDFENNTAHNYSGGAYLSAQNGTTVVESSVFKYNKATYNKGGLFIYSSTGKAIIYHCIFDSNSVEKIGEQSYSGSGAGAYVWNDNGSSTVMSSYFLNNQAANSGGGLKIGTNKGNVTVENCFFATNIAKNGSGGGLIAGSAYGTVVALNNSFYDNHAYNGVGGGADLWSYPYDNTSAKNTANTIFDNNIFWEDGAQYGKDVFVANVSTDDGASSSSVYAYNNDLSCEDYSGNNPDECLYVRDISKYNNAGNMSANPLFVDQDNGNLHIQAESPCINQGYDKILSSFTLSHDIDGNQRVIGNSIDIGADEYLDSTEIKHFPDIGSELSWAKDSIEKIYEIGITTGYPDGTYKPYSPVTRAEMAAFIVRALNVYPTTCTTQPFPDVPSTSWYCPYINAIKMLGITTGYPDGTYKPYSLVTRAQMAAFLAKSKGLNVTSDCSMSYFPDVPSTSWYCPYVNAIKEDNITQGLPDGTYAPNDNVTRAQMAVFITRTFLQ